MTAAPTFDEIYEQHAQFVWRSVQALGVRPVHAEDATQDVFVVVHRRLSEFRGTSHVRTWLFAIAMRVAADHRRRRQYRPFEALPEADTLTDPNPGPFEVTTRNEAARVLQLALDAMEERQRVVFFLMAVEELEAGEVAKLLSINANTVYSRLYRARESFNEFVERFSKSARSKGTP